MFEETQSSGPTGWRKNVVDWIDANYGTDEQLARLGLQRRAWYSFNLLEYSLLVVIAYPVVRFLGYI